MPLPAVLEGRLSLPAIASPLFIISGPELVIAQCKAGIVGSFPSLNARPAHILDQWLTRIETELAEYQAANRPLIFSSSTRSDASTSVETRRFPDHFDLLRQTFDDSIAFLAVSDPAVRPSGALWASSHSV